jgi:hypothetical protein
MTTSRHKEARQCLLGHGFHPTSRRALCTRAVHHSIGITQTNEVILNHEQRIAAEEGCWLNDDRYSTMTDIGVILHEAMSYLITID